MRQSLYIYSQIRVYLYTLLHGLGKLHYPNFMRSRERNVMMKDVLVCHLFCFYFSVDFV